MTDAPRSESFAGVLRRLRRAAGLTQEELAERAGLSVRAVGDLERDDDRLPRRDTITLLATALELGPEDRAALAATIRRTRATASKSVGQFASETSLQNTPLPPQPTPFIGRERDVETVQARLLDPNTRLLTLTGPGGVGKTRLALHVAATVGAAFPDGVIFVSLASISDPDGVLPAIGQALGVGEDPGRPLAETLAEALHARRLLLVLDNFEQVLAAGAAMQALVLAAPRVTALVTSRAALRVRGERLYAVPPLSVPAPPLPPLEALSQYEAVRLFIARAQDVDPDFAVTNTTAPAVAEICARLDGLPLAIELAAARVRLLPPDALLARLDRRLRVATGSAQDAPARQRTLRAAIAWSESLLAPPEQALFARLAVFVGGATLEAIEAVCGDANGPSVDVVAGVESLLDKSLVRRESGPDGEPRVTMLETIHEYATDALSAGGDAIALRQAHAAWYLALAERAAAHLASPDHDAWVARLDADEGNLTVAFRWFLDRQNASSGLRLVGALSRYWETRGHVTRGRAWVEAFLPLPDPIAPDIRARALRTAGVLAAAHGDMTAAQTYLQESIALFAQGTDRPQHAEAFNNLGWLAYTGPSPQDATPFFTQAHALWTELGDTRGRSAALMGLGCLALVLGETERGLHFLRECVELARESGDPYTIAHATYNLGWAWLASGDARQAARFYAESLRRFQALHDGRSLVMGLEGAAAVIAARQPDDAARLLAAATAHRVAARMPQPAPDRARYAPVIQVARDRLAADAWDEATRIGAALGLDDAVQDALTLLDDEA